ncbi:flavin reductase family protein [Streptomyces sp. ET3-23]|nr:flavin reductase family protein [Streptomyces sp. ET3-23]MCC2278132.1 flavin reductase family protein [Streptomyces sp. ET3-23]
MSAIGTAPAETAPVETVPTVTPDAFRALMGSHPGGVAVITTTDALGDPHGFTCTAWCSVSLDPPLLLVCAANTSRTLPVIAERGAFAVNLLHGAGRRAAEAFAGRTAERFSAVPWEPSPETGLPLLPDDAHTVAECRVVRLDRAGDHTIVLGEVIRTDASDGPGPAPLLYGRRRYATWQA